MKRSKPEPYRDEVGRRIGERTPSILKRLRREYERGEVWALLEALEIVLHEGGEPPRWIRDAVLKGLSPFIRYQVRTLEDAFGIKATKGARFDYLKRVHSVGRDAYALVRRAEDEGRALTDDLFDEVGERLGVSKNTARKYYLEWRDAVARDRRS